MEGQGEEEEEIDCDLSEIDQNVNASNNMMLGD